MRHRPTSIPPALRHPHSWRPAIVALLDHVGNLSDSLWVLCGLGRQDYRLFAVRYLDLLAGNSNRDLIIARPALALEPMANHAAVSHAAMLADLLATIGEHCPEVRRAGHALPALLLLLRRLPLLRIDRLSNLLNRLLRSGYRVEAARADCAGHWTIRERVTSPIHRAALA